MKESTLKYKDLTQAYKQHRGATSSTSFLLKFFTLRFLCIVSIIIIGLVVKFFLLIFIGGFPYHNQVAVHLPDLIALFFEIRLLHGEEEFFVLGLGPLRG
uniref:Uncharacterized protein n=1 Tax=Lotus japonicus TaxID=34305 RepID=I3SD53_LOTJA|nr:unknown [Lotus japonicus]